MHQLEVQVRGESNQKGEEQQGLEVTIVALSCSLSSFAPIHPQIVNEIRGLEAGVSRYNQLAHRLKLVPASAKRADGVSYELRINRDASAPTEFSNLDLKVT